ncbi:MAG: TIGR03617 family F420-dependent LLM class oxidoreductase [Hyphomicrobiaceae bacterium]
MRIATTVPQDDLRKVKAAARKVEADGYSLITTMENKHDPFLPLAVAAVETERVELATAIAISFSRSPMAVANASWDLNEASRGRFVLGLGTQVKAHNERRFSVPWGPPAPRMREYVLALKAIWRCWRFGDKLAFEGVHYRFTLMPPYFVPESLGLRIPPVTMAAVGPAMLRVAGEVADGVRLHPFCTRRYIDAVVMPELQKGLSRNGRSRENFEITGGGFLATGPTDEAVHKAREWVRGRVGFYGSTPAYYPVLAVHGLQDLGLKLNRMTREGAWDKLAGEVSDDVVDLFAACGRFDEIKGVIARRFAETSDAMFASVNTADPAALPPELIAELTAIPTPFKGFATT